MNPPAAPLFLLPTIPMTLLAGSSLGGRSGTVPALTVSAANPFPFRFAGRQLLSFKENEK